MQYLIVTHCRIFFPTSWKEIRLSGPTCMSLGYFIQYFVCKCSFREITMIKIVILDQSKPISLYLKNQKFKNPKFLKCTVIIHKNENKKTIQPILKSNSTSFMFYNIFCEMKGKKLSTGGNGGTVLISSWKCNFSIYLDIQVYYLDTQAITTLLLVLYELVPSIF